MIFEIDPDGNVVVLTNLNLPEVDAKLSVEEKLAQIEYPAIHKDLPENIKKWISPLQWTKLLVLGTTYVPWVTSLPLFVLSLHIPSHSGQIGASR